MERPLHLMHVFPNFGPGGAELRVVRIMNGMGPAVRHTVLPLRGTTTARRHIHSDIDVAFVEPPGLPPSIRTLPVGYFRRLQDLIRGARPDVLLTDVVSGLVQGRHPNNKAREALRFIWSIASAHCERR